MVKIGMLKRIIQETDERRIARRGKLFIVASGGLSAAFSVIILIVAARSLSLEETGILTIALAIAKLLLNIGKYGMRNYQVTDTHEVYFSEWLVSRVITTVVMMVVSVGYCLVNGYAQYKACIILLVCLLYAGECMEDVYTGFYQKEDRLDVSSYIQTARYVVLYLVFGIGLLFSRNLMTACLFSVLATGLLVYIYSVRTLRYFPHRQAAPRKNVVAKLLVDCFPLCLMSFILIYLSNAPKYEIDKLYDSDVQAYFGFVSMPIFAISLLSGFIFQPQIVNLSHSWKERNFSRFEKIVRRQFVYILVVSLLCIVLGWLLGIPFLSLLYDVEGLEAYKFTFVVLLIGGAGTAVINFLAALLVIFRLQKLILYAHIVTGLGIFLSIKPVIRYFGIDGATIDATLWILALAAVLWVVYLVNVREGKKLYG